MTPSEHGQRRQYHARHVPQPCHHRRGRCAGGAWRMHAWRNANSLSRLSRMTRALTRPSPALRASLCAYSTHSSNVATCVARLGKSSARSNSSRAPPDAAMRTKTKRSPAHLPTAGQLNTCANESLAGATENQHDATACTNRAVVKQPYSRMRSVASIIAIGGRLRACWKSAPTTASGTSEFQRAARRLKTGPRRRVPVFASPTPALQAWRRKPACLD